jgi:hypothetical protein
VHLGREIAHYIGKTNCFYGRLPVYWRDMSPQLYEHFHGNHAHKVDGQVRKEKAALRWIHFWLAWAAVNRTDTQVVLCLYSYVERNKALKKIETKRINFVCERSGHSLVNKEAMDQLGASLQTLRKHLGDETSPASPHLRLPPNWGTTGKAWTFAVDRYLANRK